MLHAAILKQKSIYSKFPEHLNHVITVTAICFSEEREGGKHIVFYSNACLHPICVGLSRLLFGGCDLGGKRILLRSGW